MFSVVILDPVTCVTSGQNPFNQVSDKSFLVFRRIELLKYCQEYLPASSETLALSHVLENSSGVESVVQALRSYAHSGDLVYVTDWEFPETDVLIQMLSQDTSISIIHRPTDFPGASLRLISNALSHSEPMLTADAFPVAEAASGRPWDGGTSALNPGVNCVIHSVIPEFVESISHQLSRLYRADDRILLINPSKGQSKVATVGDWLSSWDFSHPVVVIPQIAELERVRSSQGLQHIVALLRAPGGCPWDREQSHGSLVGSLIDETYELVDTIELNDTEHMQEELGDLLLQVFMHSQIAEDNGSFTLEDVMQTVSEKLVRRHPHVFSDFTADSSREVIRTWDEIKRNERETSTREESPLGDIPTSLPGLMRLQKILKRSQRAELLTLDTSPRPASVNLNDHFPDYAQILLELAILALRDNKDLEAITRDLSRDIERWVTQHHESSPDDRWYGTRIRRAQTSSHSK